MPQPKKSGQAKKKPETEVSEPGGGRLSEEQVRDYLKEVRDLVVLTGDRLQETLDDAVRRGRMTRDDADRLLQNLLSAGRRQTQDIVTEIEQLLERSRDNMKSAARKTPGGDKAMQQVDRVRRASGVGGFPIGGYEDLTAAQVTERLGDLSPADLRKVRDHERRNANRKSVLGAIERKLG